MKIIQKTEKSYIYLGSFSLKIISRIFCVWRFLRPVYRTPRLEDLARLHYQHLHLYLRHQLQRRRVLSHPPCHLTMLTIKKMSLFSPRQRVHNRKSLQRQHHTHQRRGQPPLHRQRWQLQTLTVPRRRRRRQQELPVLNLPVIKVRKNADKENYR